MCLVKFEVVPRLSVIGNLLAGQWAHLAECFCFSLSILYSRNAKLIEAGAAVLGAFKVHVKTDQGRQFFCDGITEPAKMTKF